MSLRRRNGNRSGVRWCEVGDLRIAGQQPFSFTYRPWTSEALLAAKHLTDLRPDDTYWLNIDAAQHGVGSTACGPRLSPQYRLAPRPFELTLAFGPTAR